MEARANLDLTKTIVTSPVDKFLAYSLLDAYQDRRYSRKKALSASRKNYASGGFSIKERF